MDYEYGYNASGANGLIEEVKSIVYAGGEDSESAAGLAKSGVKNISSVCDTYWDGQAKDKFVANLTKDANQFAEALAALQAAFETEIRNAASDYKAFDDKLIEEK